MKSYTPDKIRNLGLFSHGGAGKTTLVEAILFTTGANTRIGKVDDGSSVMNYDPEEVKRGITISTSLAYIEHRDTKINLLDTPGFDDFVGETFKVIPAIDAGLVVVNASGGLEVGTEKVIKLLNRFNKPRMFFLSKLDKENVNLEKIFADLKAFDHRIVPIEIPIGTGEGVKGVIDILEMKAYTYEDNGKKVTTGEATGPIADLAKKMRDSIIESIVECDDVLLNKFFEGGEISLDELKSALRAGVASNKLHPLVCGCAPRNIGTDRVLNLIVDCLPSPVSAPAPTGILKGNSEEIKCTLDGPAVAIVFKKINEQHGEQLFLRCYRGKLLPGTELLNTTKENSERISQLVTLRGKNKTDLTELTAGDIAVMPKPRISNRGDTLADKSAPVVITLPELPSPKLTYAVVPRTKQDQEKMSQGLNTLCDEDGVLRFVYDAETSQGVLSGLGDTHFDVTLSRLKSRWGVEVDLTKPRIPYRETIRGTARVQGKHKKQSGGRGQYGDVWIKFEPIHGSDAFEFVDAIVGGVVPKNFIPAVEKGLQDARKRGVLAGFTTIGFRATLDFGSYHDVDSSEIAFKTAASIAFKKGIAEAKPILLEPIYEIAVTVPDQYMGDVIGDLNSRRGRILGMDPADGIQVIKAHIPLAETYKYANDLKSMTQGRAEFTLKFDHYEEVPSNVTESVIKEYGSQAAKEDEAE